MAKEFLHDAQICPRIEQMRRERVPEGVWRDLAASGDDLDDVALHDALYAAGSERTSPGVDKNVGVIRRAKAATDIKITAKGLYGATPKKGNAFFAAFAKNAYQAAPGINGVQREASEFGGADAAGIQHFKNRAVAYPEGISEVRGFHERGHFRNAEHVREVLRKFGTLDGAGGIDFEVIAFDEKAVCRANGGQLAGGSARAPACGADMSKEGADGFAGGIAERIERGIGPHFIFGSRKRSRAIIYKVAKLSDVRPIRPPGMW